MTKIGFFGTREGDKEKLEKKFAEKGIEAELFFSEEILDKDHLPAPRPRGQEAGLPPKRDFDVISIFTDSQIGSEVVEIMPNLKHIAVRATGFDNVDLAAANARGIQVSNVPSYGENTVAEFAFGLILNLTRKIFQCVDQIKESGSFEVDKLTGFDLAGKTLGVVGVGRIGRHVVKMAKGFDMKVLGFNKTKDEKLAAELGFSYTSLEDLLEESDIVTLHVPYTKETHHLMGEKEFALMKPGAILVNTSRGAVVDTAALVAALKNGRLGGAGLDVLEEEGVVKDEMEFLRKGRSEEHNLKTILANHVLINMPNVLITPHNAFNSREAFERILNTTVGNIKSFLDGTSVNLVK